MTEAGDMPTPPDGATCRACGQGSQEERRRAQVAVADRSTDKHDCALLLDMLGLLREVE